MRRAVAVLAILLVLAGVILFLVWDTAWLISYLVQGRMWSDKGDQERALAAYDRAVTFNPRFGYVGWLSLAFRLKGSTHHNRGELDQAIESLTRAWELRPQSAQVKEALSASLFERGMGAMDAKAVDSAIADFTGALQLIPNFTEAYYQRGLAYETKGSFEEAKRDYDRSVELDSRLATAYYHRGKVKLALGTVTEAISDLERAIELNGTSAETFLWLGVAYSRADKREEAVATLQKALTLTSDGALVASVRRELAALQ